MTFIAHYKVLRIMALIAAFMLLPTKAGFAAALNAPVSGVYDYAMLVGYDPATGIVTGGYSSETGAGKFTCIFLFKGHPTGSPVNVISYEPDDAKSQIKGRLDFDAANVNLLMKEDQGGCWNVQHFSDQNEPATFKLDKSYPWVRVTMVRVPHLQLFPSATLQQPKKAYLVEDDLVGVRTVQGAATQIDFTMGEVNDQGKQAKTVTAWVKTADLY